MQDLSFDWRRDELDPRWLGTESPDCPAALEPGVFHGQGADELQRFFNGAASRNETALVIITVGDVEDE